MKEIQEISIKVHQKAVEEAIGEFRSYFKTLDQDAKKILMNQHEDHQGIRLVGVDLRKPVPVDMKLQIRLRKEFLQRKYGIKDEYTCDEISSMCLHFSNVEVFSESCYEAGLIRRDGKLIDGTPAGVRS